MGGLFDTIVNRLAEVPPNTSITAKELLHLGSRAAVDQMLSRLVRNGLLVRAGRGRYVLAEKTPPATVADSKNRTEFRYAPPRQLDMRGRPTGRGLMLGSLLVDREIPVPIQTQLYHKLSMMIRNGSLRPGTHLPSSRLLARELGVSRNTILNAYARLGSEGYVKGETGAGTVVADRDFTTSTPKSKRSAPAPGAEPQSYKVREPSVDVMLARWESRPLYGKISSLRPFNPNIQHFPFKTWRQLIARRSVLSGEDLFGYGHFMGYDPLRKVIAEYIAAYRGIRCDWRQVIITNGAQGAINLISQILLDRGDAVWMEEPGYHWARFAFLSRGADFVPLTVCAENGWQLRPPARPIQLVYVTPSCQQPLCKNMSLETRQNLIEVAAQQGAWIIEDDFDNEFSSPNPYIPAIQGLDSQARTIYIGTFAKTMFPSLRIGFMVVPAALLDVVEPMMPATGNIPGLPAQAALCDFLEENHFARHVRKMRGFYAEQRNAFFSLYEQFLAKWLQPVSECVGLQVPLLMKHNHADERLMQSSAARTLGMIQLSKQYYLEKSRQGFILGYAAPDRKDLIRHVRDLSGMLEEVYG